MKKYILVDSEGNTANHHHIKEGKHADADSKIIDESVETIMNEGAFSPILAIMEYPGAIDESTKMFRLHVWSMTGDASDSEGYMVVKEIPLPTVNTEQKLEFSIKAVAAITDYPAFTEWAEGWVNNSDRTVESIRKIYSSVNKESQELDEMQELAYMYGEATNAEGVAEKKALFDRAKLVFSAAELSLTGKTNKGFNDNIIQLFDGIEELLEPEKLSDLADEILNA